MSKTFKFVALGAALGMLIPLFPLGAGAMPIAPASPGVSAPELTLVAGGCGPGFHRGPYGGCRPNRGPIVVVPRACPRGFHLGPYRRRCVPN
jgi:hypothetical protein